MNSQTVKLGEVLELSYGKGLSDYPAEPAEEQPVRVYGTNGPIGWTKTALIESPTIVIGRKGAYRGVHYSVGPSWTIDTAYYTKVDPCRVNLKWLYYRLMLVDINGMNTGAAIPSTRREDVYAVQVLLPELEIQSRIAQVLSDYDELVSVNGQRIALLEDAARLLYREWFVHLRFPGHAHADVADGVPSGWMRTEAGQVLKLQRGHDLPSSTRIPGDVPVVSSSGITGFHDQAKAQAPGVVTGRYGTLGEVYLLDVDYWPLNTALYVVDFKGNDPLFTYYVLKYLLRGIDTQKAAVPGLDRNVLHKLPLLWPPPSLIAAFLDIVRDQHRQINVLTAMNAKLAQARDLLLPRLMRGDLLV